MLNRHHDVGVRVSSGSNGLVAAAAAAVQQQQLNIYFMAKG
jgi:hypothetical protein